MKARKALSPIVASILLMVLAIAGSIVVYKFFLTTSNVLTSNMSYQILDSRLQKLKSGGAVVYIVLKNVGSESFTIENLELSSDGNSWVQLSTQSIPQKLEPGETTTIEGVVQPSSLTVEYGEDYLARISITTVSGESRIILEVLRAS